MFFQEKKGKHRRVRQKDTKIEHEIKKQKKSSNYLEATYYDEDERKRDWS